MGLQRSRNLAKALTSFALLAMILLAAGLVLDPRLLDYGILVLVTAPLLVLATVGVSALRDSPRMAVSALITAAIALLGALLGRG